MSQLKDTVRSVFQPYQSLVLSNELVYDLASKWFSEDQIAQLFDLDKEILLKEHGKAFNAGKLLGNLMPRNLLKRVFQEYADLPEGMLTKREANTGNMLKAIELHNQLFGVPKQLDVTVKSSPENLSSDELREEIKRRIAAK